MAGALLGSIPVAIAYSFFVEHYVSGLTGSVKDRRTMATVSIRGVHKRYDDFHAVRA